MANLPPPALTPGLVVTNQCDYSVYLLATNGTSKAVHKTLAASGGTYTDLTVDSVRRSVKIATSSSDLAAGPYLQFMYDYVDDSLAYSINGSSSISSWTFGNEDIYCPGLAYGSGLDEDSGVLEIYTPAYGEPVVQEYTLGTILACYDEQSLLMTLCAFSEAE